MARSNVETLIRMESFKENFKFIAQTNTAERNSFTLGLNAFTDWTADEIDHHTGLLPEEDADKVSSRYDFDPIPDTEQYFPLNNDKYDSWDWTKHYVVSRAKNQGRCGSCYAFAFVGMLEANYAIRYGTKQDISEQQFVDCSALFGCRGGNFIPCFNYMKSKYWYTQLARHYPYTAVAQLCPTSHPTGINLGEKLYKRVPSYDEEAMKILLRKYGPIYISFNVGNRANESLLLTNISMKFNAYSTGVFDVPGCSEQPRLNHAMLLVGYGHDSTTGLDYWKVKNSWGQTWGENGLIRIRRGVNMCGIASNAYYIGSHP
ncbi:unnamed protein product [Adineta ricciae]|uniref:Uncharacterized protein n=1 Tax=Adineta ricciae TaxID=249248 RepID=A0A815Q8Z5_ADIRI|nr:unnamed protein product [Adineta ricciae]CAF1492685.1 unnamed protein product [Adineta ricciae]